MGLIIKKGTIIIEEKTGGFEMVNKRSESDEKL